MSSPSFLRTAMRQQLQILRQQRLPQITKRFQSTPPQQQPPQHPPKAPKPEDPIPVAGGTVAPLPFWQRLGPLTRAGEAYARSQRRRPYVTQVLTSLVIYLCADLSAQRMSNKKEYEPQRTLRSLVIGGLAAIPGYNWFMFLSKNFNYSSRILSLVVKISVNQTLFTPIFNTYFFGMQALLSGDGLAQTWERIKRTVPVSMVNSLKLWPAVTAFSFTFVPMEYRSIFAGVIAVGWQTYLSYLNRLAEVEEARLKGVETDSHAAVVATEPVRAQVEAKGRLVAR
jgi:hypothetical protein